MMEIPVPPAFVTPGKMSTSHILYVKCPLVLETVVLWLFASFTPSPTPIFHSLTSLSPGDRNLKSIPFCNFTPPTIKQKSLRMSEHPKQAIKLLLLLKVSEKVEVSVVTVIFILTSDFSLSITLEIHNIDID